MPWSVALVYYIRCPAACNRFPCKTGEILATISPASDNYHLTRLFAVLAVMSAAGAPFSLLMPDYLDNSLHISGDLRGMLEFPGELPGLLMVGRSFGASPRMYWKMALETLAMQLPSRHDMHLEITTAVHGKPPNGKPR